MATGTWETVRKFGLLCGLTYYHFAGVSAVALPYCLNSQPSLDSILSSNIMFTAVLQTPTAASGPPLPAAS